MTSTDADFDTAFVEPSPPVPAPQPERSSLPRMLAAFLQPQNIKWLLIAGVLILLASSLMLVNAQWHDYAPAWKYLTLLGYTAATWLVGRWCYGRLLLPRTGTVVMALTVLLLPVTFLGLNLVGRTGPPAETVVWLGLLAVNLSVAGVAGRSIFRHFLQGHQPTFLICYLLLSAAGAVVMSPGSPLLASLMTLGLWSLFALGAVKVNRHVFWLVEERNLPRIFGFFPILLLGLQFLLLFALGPARQVPTQWMGIGCALVAGIVLVTADSIAEVFQQRTGDLVRPLPWSILSPLLVVMVLCAAALGLAASGILPPSRPYALVPTASIVSALLVLVARRTRKQPFVWAALVVATIAYNFSPVFFLSIARATISYGAAAVGESRLPLAYYGLTYLPLLAALLGLGALARRRDWALVLRPVQYFSLGLPCLLLVLAFTHSKAIFPVAAATTVVLALHSWVFSDRRSAWIAPIGFLIAACGLPHFLRSVLLVVVPMYAGELLSVAVGSALLLVASLLKGEAWPLTQRRRLADYQREPACGVSADVAQDWSDSPCLMMSLAASCAVAFAWVAFAAVGPMSALGWLAAIAITLPLMAQVLICVRGELSVFTVTFLQIIAIRCAVDAIAADAVLSLLTGALLVQWSLAKLLVTYKPNWQISKTLGLAAQGVCGVELAALLFGVYMPMFWVSAVGAGAALPVTLQPSVILALVLVGWGCDAARRAANPALAAASCFAAFGVIGAFAQKLTGDTTWVLPAITAIALLFVIAAKWVEQYANRLVRGINPAVSTDIVRVAIGWRVLADTFGRLSLFPIVIAAVASLLIYTLPAQLGGAVAVVGMFLAGSLHRSPASIRTLAAAFVTWQGMMLVLALSGPATVDAINDVMFSHAAAAAPAFALAAAMVLAVWQIVLVRADGAISAAQRVLFRMALLVAIGMSFLSGNTEFTALALIAVAFATAAATEMHAACRLQDVRRVWSMFAVLATALGYFAAVGVIPLGSGVSMYVPLIVAVLLQGTARLARRRPKTALVAGPFSQFATLLPLVTVLAAIVRHFVGTNVDWLGAGSLALLLSAGFYFWLGLERRQRRWHTLSAAIVNVALALLWHELRLTDPQFYLIPVGASVLVLVQLLRREIPAKMHDPLRYLGALAILVSPTFHIVGGSWQHLLSLMLLSVAVMLAAIGLRVRAMLYAGSAFLAADLVAMVVRGSIDNPSLLWVAGLAVGAGVVTLGAIAERHREHLLQRLRLVSASLADWN